MSERTTPQETGAMLDQVRDFFTDFVVLPASQYADVVTLWTVQAHAIGSFDTSPRLIFKSPDKECGKTRALEVLEVLTPAPLVSINATIAAIFRLLADEQATLLFDEVDAIFNPRAAKENEDLRALLNAGYRRGATVARVVGEGKKMRVERFPVFAATALAAIGDLPDTIESRAIVIPMRRRAPDESVSSFRRRYVNGQAEELRGWLAQWGGEFADHLAEAEPEMPEGVTDRAADIWEPLLAIADLAGDEWAHRAREAAVYVVKGRVAEDQSVGVRLLVDVKAVMDGHDRIASKVLCDKLNELEESPWGGWSDGKGISQRDLAKRLKTYGVESKNVRLPDGSTPKGYVRADFVDPWSRYLREGSATSATSATQIRIHVADVADVADAQANRNGRAHLNKYPDGWHVVGSDGCAVLNGRGEDPGAFSTEEAARAWAGKLGWEVAS